MSKIRFRHAFVSAALLAAVLTVAVLAAAPGAARAADKCADVVEVKINDGAPTTTTREIEIHIKFRNRADWYQICEIQPGQDPPANDKDLCPWNRVPMYGPIKFTLSEGSGVKTIYFRAKRGRFLGAPETFTIELVES